MPYSGKEILFLFKHAWSGCKKTPLLTTCSNREIRLWASFLWFPYHLKSFLISSRDAAKPLTFAPVTSSLMSPEKLSTSLVWLLVCAKERAFPRGANGENSCSLEPGV